MTPAKEDPARGAAAGLPGMSSFDGDDTQLLAQNPIPTQEVCRDFLREDIVCNVSAMMANLDVALACAAVPDDVGLVYALRRSRVYWNAIAGSARDLASLNGSARS